MKKNRFLRLLPVSLLIIILISLTSLGIYAEEGGTIGTITDPESGSVTVPLTVNVYGITTTDGTNSFTYTIKSDNRIISNTAQIDPSAELEVEIINNTNNPNISMEWTLYVSLSNGDTLVRFGLGKLSNFRQIPSTGVSSIESISKINLDIALDCTYVDFDPNGGKFDPNGGTYSSGQMLPNHGSMPLKSCPFTRDGYIFSGWNTKADGSGTAFDDRGIITYRSDKFEDPSEPTLYAQWTEVHLSENITDAAAFLKSQLINRANKIIIQYKTTESNYQSIADSIWSAAVKHDTATPNGGDYILQHIDGTYGYGMEISTFSSIITKL